MKNLFKFSFIIVIVFLFSSCSKKNEAGKMIPGNAIFVAQVNLKSLGNKLSWKEIQQTDFYKKAISDSSMDEWQKKLLENPSSSGIDFEDGWYFLPLNIMGANILLRKEKLKLKMIL